MTFKYSFDNNVDLAFIFFNLIYKQFSFPHLLPGHELCQIQNPTHQ
jgi:hypothetical protein